MSSRDNFTFTKTKHPLGVYYYLFIMHIFNNAVSNTELRMRAKSYEWVGTVMEVSCSQF
jgi:hypothetical protein